MTVRAFWRAVKVESSTAPYDTIHVKVLYPAKISESEQLTNLGAIPANPDLAPFPVVIFLPGFNCGLEMYHWLAVDLAKRGLVVIIYNWVAESFPGVIGLTPGIDGKMANPSTYGTGPTALALPSLLAELDRLQTEGILAGLLDLQKVVLGGHSGGGRSALENAEPRFFPQVVAAFSYGGHTAGATALGYEPDTILPLPSSLPMLLIGGSCDGVIANSTGRYGVSTKNPTRSVVRTFHEAISGGRNDCYLAILEGANHFSIAYPSDATSGSGLLDFPATQPEEQIRSLLSKTIGLFIDAHVRHQLEAAQVLDEMLNSNNALIATFEKK